MTITETEPAVEQLGVKLRIPGNVFRDVNPGSFGFPEVTLVVEDAGFGTMVTVIADLDDFEQPLGLLYEVDADIDEVRTAVDVFNADPIAGWNELLRRFFSEQRRANADARAALDQDETFLLSLEAAFLR